jgi:hypothetical protein
MIILPVLLAIYVSRFDQRMAPPGPGRMMVTVAVGAACCVVMLTVMPLLMPAIVASGKHASFFLTFLDVILYGSILSFVLMYLVVLNKYRSAFAMARRLGMTARECNAAPALHFGVEGELRCH